MKVQCQNSGCDYVINIPPDRIPQKPIKIACPKCKGPNIIKPPAPQANDSGLYDRIIMEVDSKISALRNELGGQAYSPSAGIATDTGLSQASEGLCKKALICDDDKLISEMIRDTVAKLGYSSDISSTVDQALSTLERPDLEYGLIIIDKVFPDDAEGGFKILSKIATMPLDTRRKMFVIFISGDIKSMDTSSAFLTGANTVVNKQDINKLGGIISNEIRDYERLYKVFNQCLHLSKTYSH